MIKSGEEQTLDSLLLFSSKLFLSTFQITEYHGICLNKNNFALLVPKFSRLEFSMRLRFSGMSRVECWRLFNVSANIAVAIFRVNVYWLSIFGSLIYNRRVGCEEADWRSGGAGCYPIGDENVAEEKIMWNFLRMTWYGEQMKRRAVLHHLYLFYIDVKCGLLLWGESLITSVWK
jgi:hypothetical protein